RQDDGAAARILLHDSGGAATSGSRGGEEEEEADGGAHDSDRGARGRCDQANEWDPKRASVLRSMARAVAGCRGFVPATRATRARRAATGGESEILGDATMYRCASELVLEMPCSAGGPHPGRASTPIGECTGGSEPTSTHSPASSVSGFWHEHL